MRGGAWSLRGRGQSGFIANAQLEADLKHALALCHLICTLTELQVPRLACISDVGPRAGPARSTAVPAYEPLLPLHASPRSWEHLPRASSSAAAPKAGLCISLRSCATQRPAFGTSHCHYLPVSLVPSSWNRIRRRRLFCAAALCCSDRLSARRCDSAFKRSFAISEPAGSASSKQCVGPPAPAIK